MVHTHSNLLAGIKHHRQTILILYDICTLFLVGAFIFFCYPVNYPPNGIWQMFLHIAFAITVLFISRRMTKAYSQIWRYIHATSYIRLIAADVMAAVYFYLIQWILPCTKIGFTRIFGIMLLNLFFAVSARMTYQYLYERSGQHRADSGLYWRAVRFLVGRNSTETEEKGLQSENKIKIAIIGAGSIGVSLAEELLNNTRSSYIPCCFVDNDEAKIGRQLVGIPVLGEDDSYKEKIIGLGVQEVVFAMPNVAPDRKKELYDVYTTMGYKIKVYDYPVMQSANRNGKRHLREFDIEELLFRQPIQIQNDIMSAYYQDKVILITGGGGSIGSELCRQIAKMNPQTLIILDVYENGAYEIQQELRIKYGAGLDLRVEILSVCDLAGLEKVFDCYHPDVVLHAAAHKHVPLMEHNCCEAVKNNVFGTLNVVTMAEKYKVGRFIMVSTDKAVNPTNVMGATKRMCEMIVQSHSQTGTGTVFSATRFGNVLGSAGSVIPLFKKQIMNGGPVTLTDRRIIRYFMTIPEASQLVLQSGPMARNGELFVLDMGKPIKILDLAENMVRLSGYEPYRDIQIIETGLRPGEKLYEELLIKTDELDKTDNDLIFIERDKPLSLSAIHEKLQLLDEAVSTGNDNLVREALKFAVPTYRAPEEVNREAEKSQEMKIAEKIQTVMS